MFLDLHTHSVSSDDSRATVEQYVKWVSVLRRKGHQVDGFVLTEHRQFDSGLSSDNDIVILKGSELDTNYGHFLVYGVNQGLLDEIDFTEVGLDAIELMRAASAHGGIAIPAHPGRFGIGLVEYIDNGSDFSGVTAVEHLNGSNRPGEQERAEGLIEARGYAKTGGSDAHVVSAIGTCMTSFDGIIASEADLVRELKSKNFKAVHLDEAKA
jgi:predicted metal-dependent phosphoesterase TrpH